MKKVLLFLMFFNVFTLVASEVDRDIVVLDQTRNEKVELVFREMMNAYEEEDLISFLSFVSEDRFNQDYMTFSEAIEEDFRTYDILSIDTWVDKTTDDGVKRYLYVRWDKRYESTDSDTEINQLGYSRFLFDEINGNYKLIELAGNNFWGGSLPEWREEVPEIAGQESELPNLTVIVTSCPDTGPIEFKITNLGTTTTSGTIEYEIFDEGAVAAAATISYIYNDDIVINESVDLSQDHDCGGGSITVDPNNLIEESDETNNQAVLP